MLARVIDSAEARLAGVGMVVTMTTDDDSPTTEEYQNFSF